jgi:hypothetical protein
MKVITVVGFLAFYMACGFGQQDSKSSANAALQSNEEYSISLSAPSTTIHVGDPTAVTLTITNITNHGIYWRSGRGEDSPYTAFSYLLLRDGKEVEATTFHRRISGRQNVNDPEQVENGSSIVLAHPPGIMFVMKIDLKKLYHLSAPGEYSLQVSRSTGEGREVVRSNVLTFNLQP